MVRSRPIVLIVCVAALLFLSRVTANDGSLAPNDVAGQVEHDIKGILAVAGLAHPALVADEAVEAAEHKGKDDVKHETAAVAPAPERKNSTSREFEDEQKALQKAKESAAKDHYESHVDLDTAIRREEKAAADKALHKSEAAHAHDALDDAQKASVSLTDPSEIAERVARLEKEQKEDMIQIAHKNAQLAVEALTHVDGYGTTDVEVPNANGLTVDEQRRAREKTRELQEQEKQLQLQQEQEREQRELSSKSTSHTPVVTESPVEKEQEKAKEESNLYWKRKAEEEQATLEKLNQVLAEQRQQLQEAKKHMPGSQTYTPEAKADRTVTIELNKHWSAYGGAYMEPGGFVQDRLCMLSGVVRGSTGLVGVISSNCRPSNRVIFSVYHTSGPARVDVLPDGRIFHIAGGTDGWLSLNGISFTVEMGYKFQLLDGWHDYGDDYRRTQVSLHGGICAVSGLIKGEQYGTIADLPPRCAPDGRLVFSTSNHDKISRLDVLGDGHIVFSGGHHDHTYLNLDNIIFSPDGGSAANMTGNWSNYGEPFQDVMYNRVENWCVLSGLAINKVDWDPSHPIFTLPPKCRPKKRLIFSVNVHMGSARVDVTPAGDVMYVEGKRQWNWLSFSGIAFVVRPGQQMTASQIEHAQMTQ